MAEIVDRFEKKARFENESEAKLIRQKLDQFNILERQAISEQSHPDWKCLRRSERLSARWIRPHDENWLTYQQNIIPYMLQRQRLRQTITWWIIEERIQRCQRLLQPTYALPFLVNASLSVAELPEGPTIKRIGHKVFNEAWWPVYYELQRNINGQESSPMMTMMYSKLTDRLQHLLLPDWMPDRGGIEI